MYIYLILFLIVAPLINLYCSHHALPSESDCILHGYIKKLGGPFASAWQTRYAKLYPNRVELHPESGSTKPELVFMDQIEDVSADLVHVKGEQCIVVRTREGKIVLTNPVSLNQ